MKCRQAHVDVSLLSSLIPRPLPWFNIDIESMGVTWGRGYLLHVCARNHKALKSSAVVSHYYIFYCLCMPEQVGQFVDVAHLILSGIRDDLSLDPSKAAGGGGDAESGWIRLAQDQVSIAHVQLKGTAEVG